MQQAEVRIDHPLYLRLREIDKDIRQRLVLLCYADRGTGSLGLILLKSLERRYYGCSPLNCRAFATTGGNGVHFSFLVQEGWIRENSPVVVTIPDMGGVHYFVGEDLLDFLCLGAHRGYFALEQLAYELKATVEAHTNTAWQPTERRHAAVGFAVDDNKKQLLEFMSTELGLRPWSDAQHFWDLQQRFAGLLELPEFGT
jgi:hypothetical protein